MKKILNWVLDRQGIITLISTALIIIFSIYCYKQGLFTDKQRLKIFLNGCGLWAPAFFIALQAIQVVIPILPGSVGCLFGVVFFGPIKGFIYNYIGICAGSLWAFYIARAYGRDFVRKAVSAKLYNKYSPYINNNKFTVIFAILIFSPFAPDDFLCYLAGISDMKPSVYTAIILLGKPFGIFLYSLFLTAVYSHIVGFIG